MSKSNGPAGHSQVDAPSHYRRSPIFFLLCSFFIQTVVLAVGLVAIQLLAPPHSGPPGIVVSLLVVFLTAVVGWGLAAFLRLPTPWRYFNALLLPVASAGQLWTVPGWVYLVCAGAALLLYLPTIWSRVPYYPTSRAMYDAVLQQLPPHQAVRFIDLGCGFGGLLCHLARARPESRFVGVELSPLAYLIALLRVRLSGVPNVTIQFRDLWRLPLNEFSVVYAFLAPPPMAALWEKAKAELVPGSLVLVNSFPVPGVLAQEVTVPGQRQVTLYRYRV